MRDDLCKPKVKVISFLIKRKRPLDYVHKRIGIHSSAVLAESKMADAKLISVIERSCEVHLTMQKYFDLWGENNSKYGRYTGGKFIRQF